MGDQYTLLSWAAFIVEVMSFALVDLLIPGVSDVVSYGCIHVYSTYM
jgi:hypothetical protein